MQFLQPRYQKSGILNALILLLLYSLQTFSKKNLFSSKYKQTEIFDGKTPKKLGQRLNISEKVIGYPN